MPIKPHKLGIIGVGRVGDAVLSDAMMSFDELARRGASALRCAGSQARLVIHLVWPRSM